MNLDCPPNMQIRHALAQSQRTHHLPKPEQKQIRFFTLDEQKRFVDALPDSTAGRVLYFILGTGIRAAKLTGLRWSDIQGKQFTVARAIRRNRDFDSDGEHTYSGVIAALSRKNSRTVTEF